MRILIHSLYFHPDQTGICKYSGEMAQWLAARGHFVEVVTGFPHYPQWRLAPPYTRTSFRTENWGNVIVHRVPHYIPSGSGQIRAWQRMLIDCTFFMSSLAKWSALMLGRERFDLAISVCPPMFTGLPPLLTAWIRRVPWIFHIQDFQVDAALRLGMLRIGPLGRLLYALENMLIRRATRVSSITAAMCRRAIAKGARKADPLLLPNWADVQGLQPGPTTNAFRTQLGLPKDCLLAVYAGAMGAKQGLDLVLEAASRLRDEPQFHFLMVGGGPEWHRLKDVAGVARLERVHFLPLQPLETLGDMLRAADVHLVIQKAEAADLVMPSKLTNILSVGRPAIATASAGTALWDTLEGEGCGIVTPPEDVGALVNALRRLASDSALRRHFGDRARQLAERDLDMDAILSRFQQQISEMLTGSR